MRRRSLPDGPSRASVYLDASVVSALFDKANPERQELTRVFSERASSFRVFISEVTVVEIDQTRAAALRRRMIGAVAGFAVLPLTSGAEHLADEYVRHGAIPGAYLNDALHIAAADGPARPVRSEFIASDKPAKPRSRKP